MTHPAIGLSGRHRAAASRRLRTSAAARFLLLLAAGSLLMVSGNGLGVRGGDVLVASAATAAPHIMVIVEENKAYGSTDGSPYIIGSPDAPYINNTLIPQYTSATNWFADEHSSVPDYLDLIAGTGPAGQTNPYPGPTLADQLTGRGINWRAYMEDMPSPCYTGGSIGTYSGAHNPFADFSAYGSECANVVPYSNATADLNSASPPSFVWVTPNVCNDMHTNVSPCATNAVYTGDTWLKNNLPTIMSSNWYRQNGTIIVTWDESASTDVSGWNGTTGGHIATLVISAANNQPGTAGRAYTGGGNLFGILHGIESSYGLGYLGAAKDIANGDISQAFGQWAPGTTLGVAGGDNQLYASQVSGAYTAYGGRMTAPPAVVTTNGTPYFIVVGTDKALYVRTPGLLWARLSPSFTACIDRPAAALQGSTLTVLCTGTNNGIYHGQTTMPPNGTLPSIAGFTGFDGLAAAGGGLAVINTKMNYFVPGTDGRVYQRTDVTPWAPVSNWQVVGSVTAAAAGSTAYVALHGTDGHLYVGSNVGGAGWSTFSAGGAILYGGGIAAYQDGSARIFVEGTDRHVYDVLVNPTQVVTDFVNDGGIVQGGVGASS